MLFLAASRFLFPKIESYSFQSPEQVRILPSGDAVATLSPSLGAQLSWGDADVPTGGVKSLVSLYSEILPA